MQLNGRPGETESNYAYFPVIFDKDRFGADRNEVKEALARENIGVRKYFYPLTSTFECFHGMYKTDNTPVAVKISENVLTLPLYADLALEDVDRICQAIVKCRR